MLILKLAIRNILGAGLRTWLNVAALSFAFVTIIFMKGIYEGMNDQTERATIDAWYAGGHYWQQSYDPYDPLSLTDAHAPVPAALRGTGVPVLVRQGSIYPHGRFRSILVKGIDPQQRAIELPTHLLQADSGVIPALIGARMASHTGLKKGDAVTVQWRTAHGTFDAREVVIAEVFRTTVQEVDNDQLWIPLRILQELAELPDEATVIIMPKGTAALPPAEGWTVKGLDILLQDIHALVKMKSVGGSIFYTILLLLAMLAIFDTQVLSIWHRRKEMGTLMALGMTRTQLIALFTLEGTIHGILAAVVGMIYGWPLLAYVAKHGYALPAASDNFGFAFGNAIFPVYSAGLILGTAALVLGVTAVVSFLPTKRIASLKPTDALRGKLS